MKKLKQWLFERFLPMWCRDALIAENKKLQQAILELKQENVQLSAYINGMRFAVRRQQRVDATKEGKRD